MERTNEQRALDLDPGFQSWLDELEKASREARERDELNLQQQQMQQQADDDATNER